MLQRVSKKISGSLTRLIIRGHKKQTMPETSALMPLVLVSEQKDISAPELTVLMLNPINSGNTILLMIRGHRKQILVEYQDIMLLGSPPRIVALSEPVNIILEPRRISGSIIQPQMYGHNEQILAVV